MPARAMDTLIVNATGSWLLVGGTDMLVITGSRGPFVLITSDLAVVV